ncbi:alpha/beta fold hydrolase [Chelatococcus asaccharovorans]|uniref:alpha/beta fold hydrolase n=1 Tax=Chelatococcus asaccharovorans TaxID=28210 RepID=UPI00224C7545|nr:alpha/beta hydrolase [Chelatococcus asaccharovorans]CAH1653490.1 salicylate esterase [Chelatococcus asaccharovorans]CAH1686027.1 salicylate esterase [Chelatococcus asaccharovorans]
MGRPTFVLVHGSWHGGWCWSRVAPILRQHGADVLAPTLTGQGERSHLLNPAVGLKTHIDDVVQTLRFNEVRHAILVGHSHGGMVIRGVQDAAPDLISTLVYLDAHVPMDGDSMCALAGPEVTERLRKRVEEEGSGWILPPSPASVFGTDDPDDQAWIDRLSTPMAWKAYTDRLHLTKADADRKVYIRCTTHKRTYFDLAADRHRGREGWTVHDLAAAHNVMVTHPQLLAETLLTLI